MTAFAARNLKLYFRDKGTVFFSMLAILITIGLYVLFLGDVYAGNIVGDGIVITGAREIIDNWVMSGIVAEASITISHGVLGVVIADKARKITKDFYVSPVKKSALTGGYIICAFIVSVIMTMITFVLAQGYIWLNGGTILSLENLTKVFGIILVVNFASTGLMAFFVSLFKSQQAYSSASSVIGTLVGFVLGIYLPIGMYPTLVQWIIKCFPISHGAVLLRQIMMQSAMEKVFAGIPAEYQEEVCVYFGETYYFGDFKVDPVTSVCVLLATGVVFMGFACVNLGKKQKM